VLDKESAVVALRREGRTWQEIARSIGYASASGASDAYARASSRVVAEGIDELRALENDRLDALHTAVWDKALEGDYKALEIVLKIMDRRSRLLGLDQPARKQVEVTQPGYTAESIDTELQRLLRLMDKYPNE
jgi:DNA-binding PucR family transcriptional regulator